MQLFFGLTIGIFLILIFFYSYKRSEDVFSPLCFFAFFQFLRYVPGLFYKTQEMGVSFTESNITRFGTIELIAIISVLTGYHIHQKYFYHKRFVYRELSRNGQSNLPQWIILFIYLIGFTSRFYVLFKVGGVSYILNNIRAAYSASRAGSGYSSLLSRLMLVASIMQIKRISEMPKNTRKRVASVAIAIIMIALEMLSYLIFSRRSPALELLMFVVFAYNYLIEPIKLREIFRPRVIALIALIIVIVVVMPALRQNRESVFNLTGLLDEFSYIGRDVGCYEYFSKNEHWHGKTYINLIYSPIPSALMSNKPPVDDGLYLCNILRGYDVAPPMTVNSLLFYNSYPFSTQGVMYANFGVVGVIFGELLMGFLYARIYKKLSNTRSDYLVICYQLIIYQLELSCLSIVQAMIPLVITFLAFKFFKGTKIIKVYNDDTFLKGERYGQ